MALLNALAERCESKCELCQSKEDLQAYLVPPKSEEVTENQVALCAACFGQVTDHQTIDINHMRCLNESMWNQVPAVQALSFQLLSSLSSEPWAIDALATIYMEDETKEWAEAGLKSGKSVVHKDSNGNILQNGDSVTLIKDLNVKGGGFTAKRGTAVRRIRLDPENANHIEGKVEGQQIVILTQYVKKS